MIEYEQQDMDMAKHIIALGFLMDINKNTLQPSEENIVDVAKKYYAIRIKTFDPKTGSHL
jgi:hypothetical protein